MSKQHVLVIAILATSSSMAFAGGTVRQAPAEAEAAPVPAPTPIIAPAAPVVLYQPVNYVGIGIGASHFSGNCALSNHDTGYKIFAGHHLTPHIGVELSYVDLGRSTDDLACLGAAAGTSGNAAGTGNNTGAPSGGTATGGTGTGGSATGGAGNGGTGAGGSGTGGTGNGGASAGGSGAGGAGVGGTGTGSGSAGGSGSGSGTGTGSSVSTGTTSGGSGSVNVGSGGVTSTGTGTGSGTSVAISADPRVRGVGVALVAGMPFYNNAASIYVKGGAFFYHATDDVNGGNSNNGTSPFYGIGAQYNFGIHHSVRAEYERYHNVGTEATGKQNIDLASVSYVYRF